MTIEAKLKQEKFARIGWSIMNMTKLERIVWAITGNHRYMKLSFWKTYDLNADMELEEQS